jgi:hypothetical protein
MTFMRLFLTGRQWYILRRSNSIELGDWMGIAVGMGTTMGGPGTRGRFGKSGLT